MIALQRLVTFLLARALYGIKGYEKPYLEMFGDPFPSGKGTSSLRMFANVAFRFLPLKGVVPKSIS